MNIKRLNLYKRLRDFKVPGTVLDNIFSEEESAAVLIEAFNALIEDGFNDDLAAEEISKMIFKELDLDPDHFIDEEK